MLESHQTVDVWETAVFYHFIHTLVLLWLADRSEIAAGPRWCFSVGIIVFSGTLYLLALTGVRWLGAITPVGGIALMVGWIWLATLATKRRDVGSTPSAVGGD